MERKLWVDILTKNRNPAKGLVMKYVPPTMINRRVKIKIDETDTNWEMQLWSNSLIMYVLGENLSMRTVKNYMEKMWNFIQLPS